MESLAVFHFDEDRESFENFGKENGFRYWMATDLMKFLGYDSWASFRKAINKAMATCATNNIAVIDNFQQATTQVEGKQVEDFRLSRFACYFTTMFCDNNKPNVQQAFAYFASLAAQVQQCLQDGENCERIAIRDEITDHERVFAGVVKSAGVFGQGYAMVQNAGYRGMYNMNLAQLKRVKGMVDPKRTLLDFMGKTELAAHLFRITQTEEKIKNEGIKGQHQTEKAAEIVGKEVRHAMIKISGTPPEDLPIATDVAVRFICRPSVLPAILPAGPQRSGAGNSGRSDLQRNARTVPKNLGAAAVAGQRVDSGLACFALLEEHPTQTY